MTKSNSIQSFELKLLNCELELQSNLGATHVLDRFALQAVLESHHTRLRLLERAHFGIECIDSPAIPQMVLTAISCVKGLAFLAGTGGGLGASGIAVATATSGILWWKTTTEITLAGMLAGTLGIGTALATGGISIIAGAAAVMATNAAIKGQASHDVRRAILVDYRTRVMPALMAWAERCVLEEHASNQLMDYSSAPLIQN